MDTQHPDMTQDGSQGMRRRELLLGAGAGVTVPPVRTPFRSGGTPTRM